MNGCLPPLVKADEAVVIHINLVEEAVEPTLRHHQPGLLEGYTQLVPIQLPVFVFIDGPE